MIGISVTLLPALVALGFGFVTLAQLTTSDPGVPLTRRATAKVLDVDTYNSDDLPVPTSSQWA